MARSIRSRLVAGIPLKNYSGPAGIVKWYEAGARRARRLMCQHCLRGKHAHCESEACPCVCNDSDFRYARKPSPTAEVDHLTSDPETAKVLMIRPELRPLFTRL